MLGRCTCLLIGFLLFSCQQTESSKSKEVRAVAERFFQGLGERGEVEKMYSFYSEVVEYEDPIFDEKYYKVDEIYQLRYNWFDKDVLYTQKPALVLKNLVVNDSVAIGSGYFHPYYYKDQAQESLPFVIQLEFDENNKIFRQTDWFDYPLKDMSEAYQIKSQLKLDIK